MKLFSSLHLLVSPLKKVVFIVLVAMFAVMANMHAATYTVTLTNGNDSFWPGPPAGADGSLLGAIIAANANPGVDNIVFNIPGAGPHTLNWNSNTSGTVNITEAVIIDGLSQPGSSCSSLRIIIDGGSSHTLSFNGNSGTQITGIIFQGVNITFSGGTGNTVKNCGFNINSTGTAIAGGSLPASITVTNSPNCTIGGGTTCNDINIFSGGGGMNNVISVTNSNGINITGNIIGTNLLGTTLLSTVSVRSIDISGSSNAVIASNLIAGPGTDLILLNNCSSASITGNRLGINALGTAMLGTITGRVIDVSNSSGLTISTNIINGSGSDLIRLTTCSGSTITGNTIGANTGGTAKLSTNTGNAIQVIGSPNIVIQTNTIVGAGLAGIYFSGAASSGFSVTGNNIGLATTGSVTPTTLGCGRAGIFVESPVTSGTIAGNKVCNNGREATNLAWNSGIFIFGNGFTVSNVQVLNNYIGVNGPANYDIGGNNFAGLYLQGSGGNVTGTIIRGNVIGGNGNDPSQKSHGIALYNMTSSNTLIAGNYIGISDQTVGGVYKDIGNYANGIEINTVSGVTVGGTAVADINYICNNKGSNGYSGAFHARSAGGIMITNASSNVTIYNNRIGVAPDGSAAGQLNTATKSDNNGIVVELSSFNVTIGGSLAGQPNIIANNGTHGVLVSRSAYQTRISRNSIYCNAEKGISLDFPEEYEEGAATNPGNLSIAAPVINTKNATTVTGTAPANSTVEVFNISSSCPRVCGDANKLQGYQYVTTATADGSGNWTATGSFGSEVTATAYIAASGTSEFSTCNILCLVPTITISGTTTQCANAGDVTFTNTATVDGTYSYTWSVSGGLTINGSATNPASVVVTIGATGGTLTLSATGPCGPATSNVTITVNPRPVVSVTPTSVDVCLGTGTTLTASHTGGGGTYTYTWSPTTNLSIGGTNNNTATFSSAATVGTYNYTINVTGGNGCTDLTPATATVNVLPRPDVSAVVGSASVCQGVGTTITASHTGGNGTYTYTWSPTTDLTIGGTNNNTGTFSTSASVGVHTYTINVTGGNGCTDLTPATATVTVLARPTVSVTPTSPTVCEGLGTTLTASVSGGSGSYTFSWTPTTNLTLSGTGNNTGTFSSSAAVGTYNYNINVTGGNGCAAAADATASVTVNAAPNVAVTPTAPSVCQGVGTTLTASHTGGSGTYTYTWAPTTNLTIGGTNDNTGTFSSSATPGTYNYTINVTGGNGCADLTPATASVTVNARPTVSVTPTGPSICQGTGTTLTASVSGGSGSYTFSWSPMTDITLSGSGNNTATFSSSASVGTHTYNINVTGGNGCAANADAVATVTVDQSVTADAGSDASSCANPITLSANTPGVGTGAWTLVSGAGSFSSTSDPNGTFTFSGTAPVSAQVRWTVTNGACTADELITLNLTTGPVSDATNVAPICDQTSTSISATATNGTGVWAVVSGPGTIVDVNAASTTINGLVAGSPTVLSFTVTNGTCPTPAVDQITITVDAAVTANAGSDDDLCNATTTTLAATGTGIWTTTSGTGVVTTANDPASGVTGLTIGGTSVFTWTVTSANAACTDNASVTITSRALPVSDAGDDITSCAASVDLDANDVLAGTWTVVSGSGIFVDANDPNTSVSGLGAGTNIFEWTVSGGGVCTDASSQVTVSTGASDLILEAFGDDDTLCVGSERKLNLTASGGSQDFTYVWTSIPSGFNMTTTDPIITVVPNGGYTQYVVYAYDNNAVGCASDDDTVEVYAISRQELYLPNLMTPNEDGHNDVYIIKDVRTGHDIFPGSYFEVVNRWGQQVYKSESYDNTWDAREQSDGMYFYFLETGCGDEIYKGWVQILGNNKP